MWDAYYARLTSCAFPLREEHFNWTGAWGDSGSKLTRGISSKLSWQGPEEPPSPAPGTKIKSQMSRMATHEEWEALSQASLTLDMPPEAVISRYETCDVPTGTPGMRNGCLFLGSSGESIPSCLSCKALPEAEQIGSIDCHRPSWPSLVRASWA